MPTSVKHRAVIKCLTAEKVTPTETHHRFYGNDTVDKSMVKT